MSIKNLLPVLVVGLLVGLLLNSALVISLVTILSLAAGASYWWKLHSLDKVTYKRILPYRRGFVGETLKLGVEVENRKRLPVSWLKVSDPIPNPVAPTDDSILTPSHLPDTGTLINLFSLNWFSKIRRNYKLQLRKRGVYALGPARLVSGDIFGIFEHYRTDETLSTITVFPEQINLQPISLESDRPNGFRSVRRRLYDDPNLPVGIRDYRPGDEMRRIHWPATARTGELQVNEYQPISSREVVLCLNVATTRHKWEGYYPDILETLVKVSATWISQWIQTGYSVGLISNGSLAHSDQSFFVAPGRSPHQLSRLYERLAGVTPFSAVPFEKYLIHTMPSVSYGAAPVIVSAIHSQELVEAIYQIKRYRRKMVYVSLDNEPPNPIPGVRIIHLPASDEGLWSNSIHPSEAA